ncbi:Stp1/IreP family PP2C-type Ser/Thr phosphatase [Clostridium bovifaecis]|uniref:Stp1/IreP family PP2C-type Ser/Thr phosphatase n=1 Tax=Clostridium bovifaecis TaxID=2184719 RepID=A0A6I6EY83_9CLOT|nr:Stp1/IreP family PP2C-type Ser/Thr phosphatase [Clostridium bovifaecis]
MGGNKTCSDEYLVGYLSDKGNIREVNEDYIGCYEDNKIRLYIVADGMGGHNAGDVASKTAVESCIEYIRRENDSEDKEFLLKSAINYANTKIYSKALESKGLNGMGTTITACLVYEENAIIANVGDSSCYAIEKGGIKKITKDHSLVQELVDEGSITEQEALIHPNKNIITRALGTKEKVEIDTFKMKINNVLKFLLCTDGLSNEVSPKEMFDTILSNNNKEACRLLVDMCKNKGGRDNISVIVFEGECKNDGDHSR